MPKLTNKQRVFVQEYLIDLNATQAAIRAGYSEQTAKAIGSENLTKPDIQAAVEEAKEERSERTLINADWVLTRLAKEATADVADLYDDDGSLRAVSEWPMVWRQGLVAGLDVDEITVEGTKMGRISKIKLSDRTKRMEMIGKHVDVQAFRDRQDVNTIARIIIGDKDAGLL